MRKFFYFLLLVIQLSCTKNDSNSNTTEYAVPIGTIVKFETISDGGGTVQTNYIDADGNSILKVVPSGWTYTYTAKQNKPSIFFGGYPSSVIGNITARIYINGTLKKDAVGGNVIAYYP